MRNEGLKCTRNDYAKWLLQHVLNTLPSKGDFIREKIEAMEKNI